MWLNLLLWRSPYKARHRSMVMEGHRAGCTDGQQLDGVDNCP